MSDRFVARSAVFIAILNEKGEVLLHRRCNTGYMDGRYDLPSGHVEQDEKLLDAAVRELREETGVVVKLKNLKLWHINQYGANDQFYYNFFFVADVWHGEPAVQEAHKCDHIQFFPLKKLPKMTAGTHVALKHSFDAAMVSFSYIDQAVFDSIANDHE